MAALIYAVSEMLVSLLAAATTFVVILLVLVAGLLVHQGISTGVLWLRSHSQINTGHQEYGQDLLSGRRTLRS